MSRSARPHRVLVVDAEPYMAELAATALRLAGFDIRLAHSGGEALAATVEFRLQLLVLDMRLPDIGGVELCRRIRDAHGQIGVVLLAAGDIPVVPAGVVARLDKPFSLDDLVAQVRAVLPGSAAPVLRFADLELDGARHEVRRADNVIDLTPTEFALLRYLLENSGRVVSRPQILAHVWTYDFHGDANIVESYISFLRKKIDRFDPPLIQTLRGVGYSLRLGSGAIAKGNP